MRNRGKGAVLCASTHLFDDGMTRACRRTVGHKGPHSSALDLPEWSDPIVVEEEPITLRQFKRGLGLGGPS